MDDSHQFVSTANPVIETDDLDNPASADLAVPVKLGVFGVPARRSVAAMVGVLLVAAGVGCHLVSDLGASALDAVGAGVAGLLGITPGFGSALCISLVVLVSALCGARPGPATLAVIAAIGPVVDVTVDVLEPLAATSSSRVVLWAFGMALTSGGACLLVAAQLGAGSLELATIALSHRKINGRPVGVLVARWGLEAAFVAAALVVGGPVGAGTVAFAALSAPLLRLGIPVASRAVHGRFDPVPLLATN